MAAGNEGEERGPEIEYDRPFRRQSRQCMHYKIGLYISTKVLIPPYRPSIRRPRPQTDSLQHQKDLSRSHLRGKRLANKLARSHRRTNPPLRKGQPRMRASRRHSTCTPTHRRSLCWCMHQHPTPWYRHRYPPTWPTHSRGCRDVVQGLQPIGRGYRGCAACC